MNKADKEAFKALAEQLIDADDNAKETLYLSAGNAYDFLYDVGKGYGLPTLKNLKIIKSEIEAGIKEAMITLYWLNSALNKIDALNIKGTE